jgi:hypothetical protein
MAGTVQIPDLTWMLPPELKAETRMPWLPAQLDRKDNWRAICNCVPDPVTALPELETEHWLLEATAPGTLGSIGVAHPPVSVIRFSVELQDPGYTITVQFRNPGISKVTLVMSVQPRGSERRIVKRAELPVPERGETSMTVMPAEAWGIGTLCRWIVM